VALLHSRIEKKATEMKIYPPTEFLPFLGIFESMSSRMTDGFLLLNSDHEIEFANVAGMKLFGFSEQAEIKGKYFAEFYADQKEAEKFINASDEHFQFDALENTFTSSEGETFRCPCSSFQVKNPEGDVVTKIILLRDTADRKNKEQNISGYTKRLEKDNRELDQFSYIVSHDLKAPLRAISNLSLWLQEDLGPSLSEENKKNLDMLRNRVVRLDSLISGILEYSRIGREENIAELVDVYVLLNEVVEMLSPPAHIKIEISNDIPMLHAPKVKLLQVFSNLISNAIKYNDKAKGLIQVYGSEKEAGFEFVVEDNGAGIPSEFFEKIFVIFQTLQSRDKFESTGIGLTIVKRIIEEGGGRIWVESEVGKGSKFYFLWPKENEHQDLTKSFLP
jgi:PAS domain S-box-containing protein